MSNPRTLLWVTLPVNEPEMPPASLEMPGEKPVMVIVSPSICASVILD